MASPPKEEAMTPEECQQALRECRKANQRIVRLERELEQLRAVLQGHLPPRPS